VRREKTVINYLQSRPTSYPRLSPFSPSSLRLARDVLKPYLKIDIQPPAPLSFFPLDDLPVQKGDGPNFRKKRAVPFFSPLFYCPHSLFLLTSLKGRNYASDVLRRRDLPLKKASLPGTPKRKLLSFINHRYGHQSLISSKLKEGCHV